MPAITLTKINKDQNTGAVEFQFGKHSIQFNSLQHAFDWAKGKMDRDDLLAIAIVMCLTRQPNLNNVALLEGKTITVDLTKTNWGTVA